MSESLGATRWFLALTAATVCTRDWRVDRTGAQSLIVVSGGKKALKGSLLCLVVMMSSGDR